MTYIAEAWEVGGSLKQVQEKLEECLDLLQKTAPMENGVILEAPLLEEGYQCLKRKILSLDVWVMGENEVNVPFYSILRL